MTHDIFPKMSDISSNEEPYPVGEVFRLQRGKYSSKFIILANFNALLNLLDSYRMR